MSKKLIHELVQQQIFDAIPPGEAFLEKPFKELGRIADVAWPSQKIVFEVQFSLIHPLEARKRTHDYALLGYQTVWILHENTFNPLRPLPFQEFLAFFPHYYTNMDEMLGGEIYDLVCNGSIITRKEIEIGRPQINKRKRFPSFMKQRARWKIHFASDLIDTVKTPKWNILNFLSLK